MNRQRPSDLGKRGSSPSLSMLCNDLIKALATAVTAHDKALVLYRSEVGWREAEYYLEEIDASPEVWDEVLEYLEHFNDCAWEDRRSDEDHEL